MGLSEELLTGIQEIDEQHETLFNILEKLQGVVEGGDNWSVVYFALSELVQFARSHFVLEEALMRLHGYPDLEQHIAEHRAFSARLAQLEEQAIRQDVSLHIIEFIKQWLMNHIGGSDQSYVPCLRTMPIV
ncbi:MAG: hemerythrin family protein [Dechloromonas sp.]|jgi:hemerythrin-like metal-binding protein|uniref:Hemerythrin family protein n=1 Tax=Candidatus Dechloromonas phosphorivorans TaxID=2899244 RepID=A0A935JV40_9RHOO|nr:hemerythrin family protein [Candidatus Dechloromonas phosphorivorans]